MSQLHPKAQAQIEALKAQGAVVSDTVEFQYTTLIYYTPAGETDVHTVEVRGGWKGDRPLPRKPRKVIT